MNLHGSYPTSTSILPPDSQAQDFEQLESTEKHPDAPGSTQVGRLTQPDALRSEALRLLRKIALREAISPAEAQTFARSCAQTSALARGVLDVLEGGAHAVRALVELATLAMQDETAADLDAEVGRGR